MHSIVCGKEAICICCYNKYPVIAIILGLVSDLYNQDITCTHTGYIILTSPVIYIQYRRGLWKLAISDLNLRTERYMFSDSEFASFCSYFYYSLQKRLTAEKLDEITSIQNATCVLHQITLVTLRANEVPVRPHFVETSD